MHEPKQSPPPLPQTERPKVKKRHKALIVCGVIAALGAMLVFVSIMLLVLLSETGVVPDTKVQQQGEISQTHIDQLVEMEVIEPDEQVLYFYSLGFLSIKGDGNVLTNRRVISYQTWEGEFELYEAKFNEIAEIEREEDGNFLDDTLIYITKKDGDGFYIGLGTEDDRDDEFEEQLRTLWKQNRGTTSRKGKRKNSKSK